MQMPVFLVLFLAPVYVPLALVSGWVHAVAKVNPFTLLVSTARDMLAGTDPSILAAWGTALALIAAFSVWAVRGLRRAEAAG